LGIKKCDFCGLEGTPHVGVFSCVNDLAARIRSIEPKLRKAEDLLYWVANNGILEAYEHSKDMQELDAVNLKHIRELWGLS
jgi:hypothetical protein